MMRTVQAMRYVTPLREGGSLPAIVEGSDGEQYVMKFVGAGQGPKALVAEVIAGELARALGFRVPEAVFIDMDGMLGRSEPDAEIQDLLQASIGLNYGMRYLSSALAYNPMQKPRLDAQLASSIVWLDAYITNVDRTVRNINMLWWEEQIWLIDHGASLYFHHDWHDYLARSTTSFPLTAQHALLPMASHLAEVDDAMRLRLTDELLTGVVDLVPDVWLNEESFSDTERHRAAYVAYLRSRRDGADSFVQEAINAYLQL